VSIRRALFRRFMLVPQRTHHFSRVVSQGVFGGYCSPPAASSISWESWTTAANRPETMEPVRIWSGEQWSEALLPFPYGLMRELERAQEEHLSQVPQAELIYSNRHRTISKTMSVGNSRMIKRTAGSLVKLSPAIWTAKHSVPQNRGAVQLSASVRSAVRTDHRRRGGTAEYEPAGLASAEI